MAVSNVPAASGGGGLEPYYQKFTSSGTFTLPTGYGAAKPLLVNIQVIGGGGGGAAQPSYIFNGNGGFAGYFGQGNMYSGTVSPSARVSGAGGSGGLCATQLYLTANLTITVGGGGTRGSVTTITNNQNPYTGSYNLTYNPGNISVNNAALHGGSGGQSSASVLQATGGTPGVIANSDMDVRNNGDFLNTFQSLQNNSYSHGSGGTPAGTTGQATPLLGTLAGGSITATPVRGSFGVGGILGDATTSTGAEGTGGGFFSVGQTGAVILTWWQ